MGISCVRQQGTQGVSCVFKCRTETLKSDQLTFLKRKVPWLNYIDQGNCWNGSHRCAAQDKIWGTGTHLWRAEQFPGFSWEELKRLFLEAIRVCFGAFLCFFVDIYLIGGFAHFLELVHLIGKIISLN